MNDEIPPDPAILAGLEFPAEDDHEPGAPLDPDITLVIPAPAYEAIDTKTEPLPLEEEIELRGDSRPAVVISLAPALEAIAELERSLNRRLDGLQTLFDREIRAEGTREKVVDRLHAELQEYKQGLLFGILRPVFVDLIQLHDDIGKMIDAQAAPEGDAGAEVRRLLDLMRGFQQGVEDILYRQGVEPYEVEGDAFDPRRQRALSTIATTDPALNKRVATRLRKGFQSGDKVVRPEMVTVHAFKN
jgi:molecular chaperone GrpE